MHITRSGAIVADALVGRILRLILRDRREDGVARSEERRVEMGITSSHSFIRTIFLRKRGAYAYFDGDGNEHHVRDKHMHA